MESFSFWGRTAGSSDRTNTFSSIVQLRVVVKSWGNTEDKAVRLVTSSAASYGNIEVQERKKKLRFTVKDELCLSCSAPPFTSCFSFTSLSVVLRSKYPATTSVYNISRPSLSSSPQTPCWILFNRLNAAWFISDNDDITRSLPRKFDVNQLHRSASMILINFLQ